jgi:hypothetical protein
MSNREPANQGPTHLLPERANLEHLRKEAKQLLKAMRLDNSGATLAAAQLATARKYGFTSWRRMVAQVTALRGEAKAPPVYDEVAQGVAHEKFTKFQRRTLQLALMTDTLKAQEILGSEYGIQLSVDEIRMLQQGGQKFFNIGVIELWVAKQPWEALGWVASTLMFPQWGLVDFHQHFLNEARNEWEQGGEALDLRQCGCQTTGGGRPARGGDGMAQHNPLRQPLGLREGRRHCFDGVETQGPDQGC